MQLRTYTVPFCITAARPAQVMQFGTGAQRQPPGA
jgi:hypothetical protein